MLNLGVIFNVPVKKLFNFVKSFHFMLVKVGKNALFNGPCPLSENSGTTNFCGVIDTLRNTRFI